MYIYPSSSGYVVKHEKTSSKLWGKPWKLSSFVIRLISVAHYTDLSSLYGLALLSFIERRDVYSPGQTAWTGKENIAVLVNPCNFPLGFPFSVSHSPLCFFSFCWYLLTIVNHEYREGHFGEELEQPLFSKSKLCLNHFVITQLGFHISLLPS